MLLAAPLFVVGWSALTGPAVPFSRAHALANAAATPKVEESRYGMDPREGLSSEEITVDSKFAASLSPGRITELGSVGQLQAAIDAAGTDAVVVLKFQREGCAACASTREVYAKTAKQLGDGGYFFFVDYDKSKAFCRQVKVRFVPCGHVYKDGELTAAMPLGKKSWDAFRERLGEISA